MSKNNIEERLKEAYELISGENLRAYKDIYLVSNQILSKNPYNNNFLNNYVAGIDGGRIGVGATFLKLGAYYLKSLLHFGAYISRFLEHAFSGQRYALERSCGELIVIDTFFLIDRIKSGRSFSDPYFPGLEGALKKLGKDYVYLPFFYQPRKPLELYRALKILKKEKIPFISEYQLLSVMDLGRILYFIFTYPFHLMKFISCIKADSFGRKLLKYELWNQLSDVTFFSYSRYMAGRRLGTFSRRPLKLVSWFENLTINKNLYKGLRDTACASRIYGAQFLLYSKKCLRYLADDNEKAFGTLPDHIIVNGPYFIPQQTTFDYRLGPSLRYQKIFNDRLQRERRNILVLLPYYAEEAAFILRVVSASGIPGENILLKAHPATPIKNFSRLLPAGVSISAEDTYKLFETARIVIGGASGTLVEAASLGIPVISVAVSGKIDYNNALPELGKGIIWDEAYTSQELSALVCRFEDFLKQDDCELANIARQYKEMFFHAVSPEAIIKVFDLER